MVNNKILRRKQIQDKTGLSRSTLYQYIKEEKFPRQIHLGKRIVGWVEAEIDSWLSDRMADRDRR